jgi:hypothetical protein
MSENRRIALMAVGILLLLAGAVYWWLRPEPEVPLPPVAMPEMPLAAEPAAPPAEAVEPPPEHFPVPAPAPEAPPLPGLAESDRVVLEALGQLLSPQTLAESFVREHVIRRIVVTVDNLPRERVGMGDRAFKRVPGSVVVKNRDGEFSLSPANEARYLPLLQALRSAGPESLARLYLRYYPLFEQAYHELGYPELHFNDRLVQVIDHLLATPEVPGPLALVQPKVLYEFADPALESRSAGQKMLIRMGPVNQAQAKAMLREFRAAVTAAGMP